MVSVRSVGDGDLCTANAVTAGNVTRKICQKTPDICKVQIEKSDTIKNCRQYCSTHGMECMAQLPPQGDSCSKSDNFEYAGCDDEGGMASFHICQCAPCRSCQAGMARDVPVSRDVPV